MNHVASPDTSDSGIEREIQAKGLTAPRVTPSAIEANIISEHFFTAEQGALAAWEKTPGSSIGDAYPEQVFGEGKPLSLLTFCVLVTRNGFTVTGESACASPENFNVDIGRRIARENAVQKLWPLMGYQLREHLYQCSQHPIPTTSGA